ncbi:MULTISPECIES: hypothetical protein [Micrococcus]|uniref:Uncharacterized protein Yka (UPF0111/DUF47 family) n=1 Tax=Micrococcus yunnanensis TaxID=566027 RepID=A0ABR6D0B7_9MICC|nr:MULTISPECIES: hypothetical protein [Micrococcus]MBA9059533.1 uncharacterized protein Yka (UPF0111/DUF47 family) [Micrococcus yunnanensis]MBM4624770.1 hypothetical protein [Micrococcus sp. JV4]MCD0179099.1 hypothetical protein [Micrococcus luteus]MCO0633316.1 hypothetical protein [Micrococcus yunnanensis]QTP18583.1 hypothetical protein J7660_00540 [Micrococcus luteus]
MSPRMPWLFTRDTPALRHMADLAEALHRSVHLVAQVAGTRGPEADRAARELEELDSSSSATLMAFLTALRSAYVTPLPRQDLYRLASGVHATTRRVVSAGVLIQRADLEELPTHALDVLETVGRQAELLARGAAEMRDLDALEATWMQLLRASRRTERIMVEWLADLGMDLLQRDYNRQREVAWALHAALEALSRVNMDLGMVLVRES